MPTLDYYDLNTLVKIVNSTVIALQASANETGKKNDEECFYWEKLLNKLITMKHLKQKHKVIININEKNKNKKSKK